MEIICAGGISDRGIHAESLTIDAKINEGGVQAAQVGSLLVVNAVSFAMIFVIMYFDTHGCFCISAQYMLCI